MEHAGPEAQHDGDSYNFVIVLCALDKRIALALKHMQSMYERDTSADATDANCGRADVCCSGGDFETAVNTVHDMELAFSSLQDSKGLEILSPCSSLWPLVLAIAQAGPGALDVAYYKLAEIHGSG
ncbi:unnamed protein product [Sphagnum jensenii]